jgi:hypothetical protein
MWKHNEIQVMVVLDRDSSKQFKKNLYMLVDFFLPLHIVFISTADRQIASVQPASNGLADKNWMLLFRVERKFFNPDPPSGHAVNRKTYAFIEVISYGALLCHQKKRRESVI